MCSIGPNSVRPAQQARSRSTPDLQFFPFQCPTGMGAFQPRPCRHRGPSSPRPQLQTSPNYDRQDHLLAGSRPYHDHDGGNSPADLLGPLGFPFWHPRHRDFRQGRAIHLGDMSKSVNEARHQCLHDYILPPTGERQIVEHFPQGTEEHPSLHRKGKQFVDAIPPLGHARHMQRAIDMATSTAEVVFRAPQRIPGLCFQTEQSRQRSVAEQLELARSNVAAFSPESLELRLFQSSPFIVKTLRTVEYAYVRDDRLGKPSLAPK